MLIKRCDRNSWFLRLELQKASRSPHPMGQLSLNWNLKTTGSRTFDQMPYNGAFATPILTSVTSISQWTQYIANDMYC